MRVGFLPPQSFLQVHAAFSVALASAFFPSERATIVVIVSNVNLATTTDISPCNQFETIPVLLLEEQSQSDTQMPSFINVDDSF
jgi:hypothetical protein